MAHGTNTISLPNKLKIEDAFRLDRSNSRTKFNSLNKNRQAFKEIVFSQPQAEPGP